MSFIAYASSLRAVAEAIALSFGAPGTLDPAAAERRVAS